jgi:hypothetical protein
MDLTGLSREDLAEVIDRLAVAQVAADVLADAGLAPVIDLTDDGMMLSASWGPAVSGAWEPADAGPVVIEPVAGPWDLSVEEAALAGGDGQVVMKEAPRQQEPLVDDPAVIDLHLLTISRRGDWHMGADLALMVVLMDNPFLNDRGIADLIGRDIDAVAERVSVLTDRGRFTAIDLAIRLRALLDAAAPEAEEDTGAAKAPPPEEDAARGAFPGGGQDLPAIQPGMTGLSARGEGSTTQSPEPAPAVGESGGAAAEDSDLSGSSPPAEPPAAAPGTAAAVTAPPLPGPHPPAGERVGAPALITGALSDAEKAEIRRRHAAGETSRDIAAALNRRVQLVGAWISGLAHQEKIAALKASSAKDGVSDSAPAAKVAPEDAVAPKQGLQRPGIPDHILGEHRRIWSFLDGLAQKPPFDAATDLAVYDAYDSGRGMQALALDLGVGGAVLVQRYKTIVGCILDAKGRPRPELKMKLSAVLRWRAEAAAKAAGRTAGKSAVA